MNWLTFTILACVAYAIQVALQPVWSINGREPMLLLILLVFVGLQAPAITAAWSAILLGLLVDIMLKQHETGLIGPWALGFLAAGFALVQLRNLLFRDSMFTIGIMTMVAGVFALLVSTTLHKLRTIPLLGNEQMQSFSAADQLYHGFATLLYTAIIAIPVGYGLLRIRDLWGFSHRSAR